MKAQKTKILCKQICILCLLFSVLGGCQDQNTSSETEHLNEAMTKSESIMEEMEPITSSVAIYDDKEKEIYAAAEVRHMDRLRLDKIRKEAHKKLSEEWPNETVHFSTDKKALIELRKLNKDLAAKKMGEEELKKRLTKIEEHMKG
ncbi:hypothetical protein [Alteribacillus iranensis]|uniref:Sporulation lipoprotein YhcN/YlaJ (Spore_YhcN_YlaJ) n=1 Tax=Alteribacillus iranensis TaxID=930128 RepID=A0A1I1ZLW7_9BACI|nr:hypothetical protein [Alteribacillus iranensis]SFE32696.1 hypothetical protein SAMN05192532_101320 [Alteribacillus iranensis]